jgi:lambda repressor-like predicted transcriptional regulator
MTRIYCSWGSEPPPIRYSCFGVQSVIQGNLEANALASVMSISFQRGEAIFQAVNAIWGNLSGIISCLVVREGVWRGMLVSSRSDRACVSDMTLASAIDKTYISVND